MSYTRKGRILVLPPTEAYWGMIVETRQETFSVNINVGPSNPTHNHSHTIP